MSENGGWVFISHSHQDIAKVRKIRDHLEGLGFEPLMFYLKCLSDEDEIADLIKREIDEREWFIYADSPKARDSKWVRTELEYMEQQKKDRVFTIDLNKDMGTQLREIEQFARQMKVFISYARKDSVLFGRLKEKIVAKDMLVLSDADLTTDMSWSDQISWQINDTSRNGFVLLLVTENNTNSQMVHSEIQKALAANAKIIPVYVGKASLDSTLLPELGRIQGVHISSVPTDEELEKVVEEILGRVEYYHSDFTTSHGFRSAKTIHLPPIAVIDNLTFWDCEMLECVYIPDSVVYITDDAFDDLPNVLIKCREGSFAHGYCIRHHLRWELTEEA